MPVNQTSPFMQLMTDEAQLLGFINCDALDNIPKAEVNRIIKMLESNRKVA